MLISCWSSAGVRKLNAGHARGKHGSEELGNGLQALFDLEAGIYVDTGTSGQVNRLFGRQAWVGLADKWGQLTLGRNYNMLYNSMPEVEIIGPAQYGLGSIEPAIPNGRTDNSVAYKGTFNAITVGGSYSLGRDVSNAGGPGGTNCAGENGSDAWPAANGRPCCATTPHTDDFSKRTSTYVAIGHVSNQGSAAVALSAGGSVAVGDARNGIITGIKHAF